MRVLAQCAWNGVINRVWRMPISPENGEEPNGEEPEEPAYDATRLGNWWAVLGSNQ